MRDPVYLCIPREYGISDFWRSVYMISEEHRRIPQELRDLAGVHKTEFHPERLPVLKK